MSRVDLGFVEPCEPWQLDSYHFPSKLGGKPAWLDLENLPKSNELRCEHCQKPMMFLCQIYAPLDDNSENFHRTLFIFLCRNAECCQRNNNNGNIKVFRSNLQRQNKFYSYEPPEDKRNPEFNINKWVKTCNLCGCLALQQCGKCKKVDYCSREHQISDWKQGHKMECDGNDINFNRNSISLFPEFEIVLETEQSTGNNSVVNEDDELDKFKKLEVEGKAGTMQSLPQEELEKYGAVEEDKVFLKFRERTKEEPEQILRYDRGGEPLWIASGPKPEEIPDCSYCGGSRQFEFQIMPQLLAILKEDELDWGVIAVYTCSKSCSEMEGYKSEFVFKQDVALDGNL